MFNRSKIYVAGHAGLLGSALLRRLASEGCANVVTRARSVLDLTDWAQVDAFFLEERPEYVFMAAGLTGGIMANKTRPAEFLHANISIQDNLFEACRRYGVKRAVFYGSSCVYPIGCPQPMKEEYLLAGPLEVTSEAYAIAKIAGLTACKAYNRQDGVDRFVALIPNSIYGPDDDFSLDGSHVLSALIRKITDAKEKDSGQVVLWGSGSPLREFIFSADAADASVFAILNARGRGHYNVGSGMELSIRDLAKSIAGAVGFKGEIAWDRSRPDGAKRKLLDGSRFAALGWRPKVTLEEGIAATCEWYLKNVNSIGGALCR